MSEGSNFNFGADFSGLADKPPAPEKRPEIIKDDDDDDTEGEEPKTIYEYLKKEPENPEKDEPKKAEKKDDEDEKDPEAEEDEIETDAGIEPESREITNEEEPEVALQISESREEEVKDPAAVAFHETLQDELKDGKPIDEALNTAEEKTLEIAGIEVPEEPEPELELEAKPPMPVESVPGSIEPPVEPPAEDEPVIPVPPVPPPTPPIPPTGPGGRGMPPFGPGGPGGPGGLGTTGGNVLPATPNVLPDSEPDGGYDRHSHAPYVLAGGLVGYLLGRRRGRIKTEKKLLPIQHKLEKEVADLRDKIFWREARVQSLIHEQIAKKPETERKIAEHIKAKQEQKNKSKEKETELQRRERLGKFAVITERPEREDSLKPEIPKSVELMTLAELLLIAEHIPIEQSNLKRLFEANRLDDEGLRRIIRAYLRGERYERLLRENLQKDGTHERLTESHEFQPGQSTDTALSVEAVETHAPHAQSLHEKLQQAGTDTPAPFAEWVEPEPVKKQQNNTVIVAATATTLIIAILAVVLFMR